MNVESRRAAAQAAVVRYAWAKVNLYLHVLGRRPDGYHELDSLVVFLGVGDRLSFEPAERLSLDICGPFAAAVPKGLGNLVLEAAQRLAETCGVTSGARIRLEKRLPVAAGIGGGSADAAATLDGLSALWQVAPSQAQAHGIARDLGADVPICLFGRPAFMAGVGEKIERAPPLPPAWLVLGNPGQPLETARVFKAYRGPASGPARRPGVLCHAADLATALGATGNDLQAPAVALMPAIETLLGGLSASPGCLLARMSGSGATCFGLFATRDEALGAVAKLRDRYPGFWLTAAPLLHGKVDFSLWDEADA